MSTLNNHEEYLDSLFIDRIPISKCRARNTVISWISDVYVYWDMSSDTFLLAARLFDYCLFKKILPKKLQLLAIGCLWIAEKYCEEIFMSTIRDWQVLVDFEFTANEIRNIEKKVLETINYCVGGFSTSLDFSRYFCLKLNYNRKQYCLTKYYCEMACAFNTKTNLRETAAIAILLTKFKYNLKFSAIEFEKITKTKYGYILVLSQNLMEKLRISFENAITRKYSEEEYFQVSRDSIVCFL